MARRYSITLKVRFYEVDAFNHVNNGVYHFYLDHARDMYFIQALAECRELSMDEVRYVVARTEVDFLAPAKAWDVLEISGEVSRFGRTSLTFDQEIVRKGDHASIARARSVLVWTDSEGRPVPVPKQVHKAFT
ncbi:MAG: acyl-CoA thioesterase [Acidobacteriota bacterium]